MRPPGDEDADDPVDGTGLASDAREQSCCACGAVSPASWVLTGSGVLCRRCFLEDG